MKKNIKKAYRFLLVKHKKISLAIIGLLGILYVFCLPSSLFSSPTSVVIESQESELLGASIAQDGQWRFPHSEEVPDKFKQAIIVFEDKRFELHWGIDPIGLVRAIWQNIKNKSIVSGGSTLTMQVIRMARKNPSRNLWNKTLELIMATRLELTHSKKEILALYSSNAPFGGNVVGLDAAAWRYYGKNPNLLSWGEAATLAVLPNSPALIHLGRNRQALLEKRNRLINRMLKQNVIDETTAQLAQNEPLPQRPLPLPRLAPHLLDRVAKERRGLAKNKATRTHTTIRKDFQIKTNHVLERHQERLASNGIHNACAIIVDVETGDILSYVGNMPRLALEHSPSVDIIQAPRSTGSILKPFLYAAMLHDGSLLPQALVSDIPTQMGKYRPMNYFETYDGAVPANRAIIRSLNVPLVKMLQKYSVEKFHFKLKKTGMTTLVYPPHHYGLTLVLGGAEGNIEDITGMYASMARTLKHFYTYDGKYDAQDWKAPHYISSSPRKKKKLQEKPTVLSAAAIWETLETIQHLERPSSEGNWEIFSSDEKIAWKTGTSFGFRDAWAVGVTAKYAVGVWVGNADGEGRPHLMGITAAAPILFDIFDFLPNSDWFVKPEDEMTEVVVCAKSGHLALPHCEPKDTVRVPQKCATAPACSFHQKIHVDTNGKRVNASCLSPQDMTTKSWFVLPPLEEHYYQSKNPNYSPLPPFRADCKPVGNQKPMQMIYPKYAAKIYVPIDYDGNKSKTVFKATHRNENATLYWHLDNQYVGQTSVFHHLELNPPAGKHILTLIDDKGNSLEQRFEILSE